MRALETPRLLLLPATEPLPPDELETVYRIYVEELEGQSLTREAFEQELLFDLHLAHNNLGRDFGRPAIIIKANRRRIGHCVFLPRCCSAAELTAVLVPTEPVPHTSIEVEIGWAISNQYRNQGYATEAAQALVAYGFVNLDLARLVAFTEQDNAPSLRVMHKLGMHIGQCRDSNEIVGVIENSRS